MSSAGTLFDEKVYAFQEEGAGSRSLTAIIENDGCIITVKRLSGAATITGTLSTNVPGPMAPIELETILVDTDDTLQIAHVTGQQILLALSWDGAAEFRVLVKPASGSAISALKAQTVVIDTFDGFATQKVTVGTGVTTVTNTAQRRSIGIRNWSELSGDLILYVKEDATDVNDGWPLGPGEGLSLDVDTNTSLYLAASADTIDTRIVEITRT